MKSFTLKKFKAFTLIELLVVIAIIGLLATLSVLALQNARINSRDAKRLADVKQLRSALELYYNDAGHYPTADEFNSGKIEYYTPGVGTSTYMMQIPSAPTPADGSCSNAENTYTYLPDANGSTYVLNFCIAKNNGDLPNGKLIAHPGGLSWSGQGSGNTGGTSSNGFEVVFGGSGYQYISSIQPTSDGAYVVVGETDTNGTDVYVAKLNSSGSLNTSFGSGGTIAIGDSAYQTAYSVQSTSDGGYVVAGETDINGGDVYVAKITSSGSLDTGFGAGGIITIGGSGSQQGISIETTSDGGYIVVGTTTSNNGDMYIVKLNANGSMDTGFGTGGIVTIGDAGSQSAYSVQVTADGGYIVAGTTSTNAGDIYIVKLNADGSLNTSFGTGGEVVVGDSDGQSVSSIQIATSGGYIIAGTTSTNAGDMYIVKLNANGSMDAGFGTGGIVTIGDAGSQAAQSVQNTTGSGYIVGGFTDANGGDMYIVKLNTNGSLDTSFGTGGSTTFGDSGAQYAYSIQTTTDGGYIVAGETDANGGDAYIVKMDGSGSIVATCTPSCGAGYSCQSGACVSMMANWNAISVPVAKTRDWVAISSDASGTNLVAAEWGGYIYTSSDSGATWIQRQAAGQRNWGSFASSADGTKVVGEVYGGYIYTSSDSGATWTLRASAGARDWAWVAISADGTKMFATGSVNDYIYSSSDSGVNWSVVGPSAGEGDWVSVAVSDDGTKVAALSHGDYVKVSSDSGATWTTRTTSGTGSWQSIAASADGNKLIIADNTGHLKISTDFGVTWSETATSLAGKVWLIVNSSADGNTLFATDGHNIYKSADSGANWAELSSLPYSQDGIFMACSDNGNKLLAAEYGGHIYTSTNSGTDWAQRASDISIGWQYIASSVDGAKLVAAVQDGYIYTSVDSGTTWTKRVSSGKYFWYSIASSADGTKLIASSDYSIHLSTDSGATWTKVTLTGGKGGKVASSADGTKLAVAQYSGHIFTSSDSGVTWTERAGSEISEWGAITSSDDGTKLAAITTDFSGSGGYIYTSSDSGATWVQRNTLLNSPQQWYSIDSSVDGNKLVAVDNGMIWISNDSGATWSITNAPNKYWYSVSCSNDRQKIIAAVNTGYIFVSYDNGTTWIQQTNAGSRNWQQAVISGNGAVMGAVTFGEPIYIAK